MSVISWLVFAAAVILTVANGGEGVNGELYHHLNLAVIFSQMGVIIALAVGNEALILGFLSKMYEWKATWPTLSWLMVAVVLRAIALRAVATMFGYPAGLFAGRIGSAGSASDPIGALIAESAGAKSSTDDQLSADDFGKSWLLAKDQGGVTKVTRSEFATHTNLIYSQANDGAASTIDLVVLLGQALAMKALGFAVLAIGVVLAVRVGWRKLCERFGVSERMEFWGWIGISIVAAELANFGMFLPILVLCIAGYIENSFEKRMNADRVHRFHHYIHELGNFLVVLIVSCIMVVLDFHTILTWRVFWISLVAMIVILVITIVSLLPAMYAQMRRDGELATLMWIKIINASLCCFAVASWLSVEVAHSLHVNPDMIQGLVFYSSLITIPVAIALKRSAAGHRDDVTPAVQFA